MIGNCVQSLALTALIALLCFVPPATASEFEGSWTMVASTTSGHCGRIKVGLGIKRGRIYSTSGKFVFRPIHVAGIVSPSGQAKMNAVAGPRTAQGVGRFNRHRGGGTWTGTGPSGVCSGFWNAIR
jgi:hypothetical protein